MVQRVDRQTAPQHGRPGAVGSLRPASNGPSGSASFDLCPSKLAIPSQRRGSLRRTPLVSQLRRRRDARFVSIVAPAGYGKTTLMALWAAKDVRPFAWVSLGEADNDPVVLLSYIAAALNAVEPVDRNVFRGVAAGGDALWSTAVPRLGSAIASVSTPIVLVLDDVHELTDAPALDAVDALALHVPPGSLLVLAGRGEAALPHARLRVNGDLVEIGPAELALTDSEAEALLAGAGAYVSADEARALNQRAEGWAAGLYLAALSLQASQGPTTPEQFSGDDRFVTEYLRSEHLAHLKPKEIEFLTRTSVLDRMTGPFCDALLGRTDSAKVLADLERSNLFVVALDHHSGWYRYHHLFRDMLQAELERREPDMVAELHRRAGAWCAENHLADWAIEHSSAAGDLDWTADLVAANVLPYYRDGRVATVERWLTSFDEPQLLARYPAIAVFGAWVNALRGRPAAAERWALAVENSDYEGPMPDGSRSLRPWAALLRARLCRQGVDTMRLDAELALQELDPQSMWMPVALLMRGIATLLAGETDAALPMLERAAEAAAADGATYAGVVAHSELALLAVDRGDLDVAEAEVALARSFVTAQEGDYVVAAILYAAEARLALARGQGTRARAALVAAQRLRPMLTRAMSWFAVQTTLELARAHLALADADGARTLCLEADDLFHSRPELGTLVARVVELREELAAFSEQPSGWASTLTTAELRLLPLLTTHLTFREIAERLFVSRNTVKTQAISVYRKLDATSRSEAIERAIELGLVDEALAARPVDFTRTG